MWAASLVWEHAADKQKKSFIKDCQQRGVKGQVSWISVNIKYSHNNRHISQVCEVGLWRWCRHPNYFGISTSQQGSLLTYFANNVQFYNVFSRGPDSCQTQVTQAITRRVDGLELPDPRHAPLHHLEPLLRPGPGSPGGAPQHLLHNVGVRSVWRS